MFEVIKRCFNINLNDYENINFDLEINKVIAGASIVLMIAIVLFHIRRGNIRNAVMQLIRHGAFSEENAKTVKELGVEGSSIIKALLSGDNQLTKVVARVGEKQYSYEEYVKLDKKEKEAIDLVDFEVERFYVREGMKDRAWQIVDRYVTSVPRTVAVCIFVSIITFCIIACMPGVLQMIDNLLESAKI